MATQPILYLIAGCNGAGKTTFAYQFLPKEVKCLRFLNADEIAKGLSPFDPAAASIKAGRLLLSEVRECLDGQITFGLESTLSGRTYVRLLREARQLGYEIHLHYLWLRKVELAIKRVQSRVKEGGHNVPEVDIRRRFAKSIQNFLEDYAPLADKWAFWDNRFSPPPLLAESQSCSISELKVKLAQ